MEAKLILRQGTSPFTENYRYKIQDGKYGRMEDVKNESGDKVLKFAPLRYGNPNERSCDKYGDSRKTSSSPSSR